MCLGYPAALHRLNADWRLQSDVVTNSVSRPLDVLLDSHVTHILRIQCLQDHQAVSSTEQAAAALKQAEYSEARAAHMSNFVAYYDKHTPGTQKTVEILQKLADKCARQGTGWLEAKMKLKYGEGFSEFSASRLLTAAPRRGQPPVDDDSPSLESQSLTRPSVAPLFQVYQSEGDPSVHADAASTADPTPEATRIAEEQRLAEKVIAEVDQRLAEKKVIAEVAHAEATRIAEEQRLAEKVIADVEAEITRISEERRLAAEKAAFELEAARITERLATETVEAAMEAARIALRPERPNVTNPPSPGTTTLHTHEAAPLLLISRVCARQERAAGEAEGNAKGRPEEQGDGETDRRGDEETDRRGDANRSAEEHRSATVGAEAEAARLFKKEHVSLAESSPAAPPAAFAPPKNVNSEGIFEDSDDDDLFQDLPLPAAFRRVVKPVGASTSGNAVAGMAWSEPETADTEAGATAAASTQDGVGVLRCLQCTVEIIATGAKPLPKFCNACGHPTEFGRFCIELEGTGGVAATSPASGVFPASVSEPLPSPPGVTPRHRSSSSVASDVNGDGIGTDVTIDKTVGPSPGSTGLSFDRVEGKGHAITAMLPGCNAARTGQIALGMIIIAVNGADCRGLSTKDMDTLMLSGNNVVLTVLAKPLPVVQPRHLQTLRVIGEGRYGKVSESLLKLPGKPTQVVVYKFASSGNHSDEVLKQEIAIIRHICNHGPNPAIVACLGLVQDDGMLGLVLEHCTRLDLQSIVKRSETSKFSAADLTRFAHQVAKGLGFLHQIHVLHRDLALRNIVVMEDWTVKICDFGLSRIVSTPHFVYQMTAAESSPVKWLAPENLKTRCFSKPSDVWSFGILCWELFSKGAEPYRGIASSRAAVMKHLAKGPGSLPPKPKLASSGMYEIVRTCWNKIPGERPTAPQLARALFNCIGRA